MPSRVQKLRGHAEHLLDGFIGLREKYAMLDRMLFDSHVVKQWGARDKSRGFFILRNTLYLACVQEIAKLSLDSDARAPSINNFVQALADRSLRGELREHYAVWHIGATERDPELLKLLEKMELKEQAKRRERFEVHTSNLALSGQRSQLRHSSTRS